MIVFFRIRSFILLDLQEGLLRELFLPILARGLHISLCGGNSTIIVYRESYKDTSIYEE